MALIFSFATIQPCPCQEKSCMVGVDFVSLTHGSACVNISHAFHEHWSVTGEASLSYNKLRRKKSTLEQEHDAEFTSSSSSHTHHVHSSVMISYWLSDTFIGPYISVGVQSGSKTDIITETGYFMPIWKGLCLSTSVRAAISESAKEQFKGIENIRLGLHYKF